MLPGVAKGLRLGTWVANIRSRRATLSPEEVASVEQLVSPSARHCKTHTITPACICDICLTGRGCTRCTTQVGWNWGTTRYTFDQMVAALSVYLQEYKDCPSTPFKFIVGEASGRADLELRVLPGVAKGLRLGSWVSTLRNRRATLSTEEVASVERLVSPSARHCETHNTCMYM